MNPVIVVYRGQTIAKGNLNVLPRVTDYLRTDGGILVVEAVVIDCKTNNNGGAIIYARDPTLPERNKLNFLNS